MTLAKEIAWKVIAEGMFGVFALEAWYLCEELVGLLEGKERLWVSRMKMKKNGKVKYRGRLRQVQELAGELKAEEYARVEIAGKV